MRYAVSPDAIHEHVKTKTEETNRLHYAAPELATAGVTTAADIYAFGICTLEVSHTKYTAGSGVWLCCNL